MAFSPNSKKIACQRSSDIYVCDLESIEKNRVIVPAQEAEISQIEWSSNSENLAILQRDSSIVMVAKFKGESLVDDEERWIDLKSAGNARCCAWSPSDWIAIASSSGRIFLSHEKEGGKWGQATTSGPVAAIAASHFYWALAIPKEGISICNATDCSLVRRVVGSYIGLTRFLEFCPVASELLMAYDGKQCAIVSTRSKRFVPVDVDSDDGHVSACAWLRNKSSSLVVVKTKPQVELLQIFVEEIGQASEGTYQINVSVMRSVVLGIHMLPCRIFEMNAFSKTVTGVSTLGEGRCELFVASYATETEKDDNSPSSRGNFTIASIRYMRKNSQITNFIISPNSLFGAMTTNNGIIQLFRLMSNNEQITEVLTKNLTPVEFILRFMLPGLLGLLLFLAAFVSGSPWQALEVGFEKFCGMHFRL